MSHTSLTVAHLTLQHLTDKHGKLKSTTKDQSQALLTLETFDQCNNNKADNHHEVRMFLREPIETAERRGPASQLEIERKVSKLACPTDNLVAPPTFPALKNKIIKQNKGIFI